ncbi:MAG: glycosyltransferase [Candidatus Sumerlaeaceae bacterium]|nr:glycosyltransferase [Candidatus Sumerlaeaceae bacterium]
MDDTQPSGDAIIVVPCFDEERRLPVAAYEAFAANVGPGTKLLFANDGSRDGTWGVLEGLRERSPGVFLTHNLPQNMGKAEAVRQGILEAFKLNPGFVGYWDADLATPLDEIPGFLETLRANPALDMVLGARVQLLGRQIHRKMVRHYLGRIFATVASTFLRIKIYDTQCGAKIFRNTPRIREIFSRPFVTRWIFDVELLVRYTQACLAAEGHRGEEHICEIPLQKWEDVAGSKVKSRDFFKGFFEFLKIMRTYR